MGVLTVKVNRWLGIGKKAPTPVAGADKGFGLAANDGAEMLDLVLERVALDDSHHAHFKFLPPRAVFGPGIGFEPHGRHRQSAVGAGDDVAVLIGVARVGLVLLRCLLPAARAGGGVGQQKGAEHAVGKTQIDRHRVFHGKAAGRVR